MKGLFPWLYEVFCGTPPAPSCRTYACNLFQHKECGAGNCAMHCRAWCQGTCKKQQPKLGVVLGMRR